jgi:hypothetical protein
VNLLRLIAAHRRGGHGEASSWMQRKQARIAELHRELHRANAEQPATTEA